MVAEAKLSLLAESAIITRSVPIGVAFEGIPVGKMSEAMLFS